MLGGDGVIVGPLVAHVVWFVAPEVGLWPGEDLDPPVVSDWPGAAPVGLPPPFCPCPAEETMPVG